MSGKLKESSVECQVFFYLESNPVQKIGPFHGQAHLFEHQGEPDKMFWYGVLKVSASEEEMRPVGSLWFKASIGVQLFLTAESRNGFAHVLRYVTHTNTHVDEKLQIPLLEERCVVDFFGTTALEVIQLSAAR